MSSATSFIVRPFRPADEPSVRKIFLETAFHGQSYDHFFDHGDWLADFMTSAYVGLEPESIFVVDVEGAVKGYLTGSLQTNRYRRYWTTRVLPRLVWKFFTDKLWLRKRTWFFLGHSLVSGMRGEQKLPSHLFQNYPAHFHINLSADFRGQGAGTRLANAFFDHMRKNNVKNVHIRSSYQAPHQPFFESIGFKQLGVRRLTLWDYLGVPPYYLMTYGLSLADRV